jgi:hypothetical protein
MFNFLNCLYIKIRHNITSFNKGLILAIINISNYITLFLFYKVSI